MLVGHCYCGRLGKHVDELLNGVDVELDPSGPCYYGRLGDHVDGLLDSVSVEPNTSWTLLLWMVRRAY